MKSLLSLTVAVLRDCGAHCGVDVSRDELTVARRTTSEGISFLEITLPSFSEALEGALASGCWLPAKCPAFGRARGALPRFLRGFTSLVFGPDGALRSDASADAIWAIRQICRLHKKVFAVCAPKYEARSMDAFVKCEEDVSDAWFPTKLLDDLSVSCVRLFGSRLSEIERAVAGRSLVPRHGPGGTADRLSGNAKYDSRYWPQRLQAVADYREFIEPTWLENPDPLFSPPPDAEIPVKVVSVPKTANKARVIAMEPTNVQYVQQSLLREFTRHFSGGSPFVDLSDQEPNRRMAQRGSVDGSLSTIDLSEASDRVALDLVRAVFKRFPLLLEFLEGTRSSRADVPGYGVIPLAKFASMGSALCFPVESIVFATIAAHAVACERFKTDRPTKRELYSLRNVVRVFGDDIVVPRQETPACLRLLVQCGARPNATKSFWEGSFRESCGKDFWRGHDVTVVYRRARLPETRRDANEIASAVSLRNQLYWAGLWRAAGYMDERLQSLVPMPLVSRSSAVMGRESVFGFEVQRWHTDYQSPLVKGAVVVGDPPRSVVSERGALLKCLLPGRQEPFLDVNHLMRCGRPRVLRIKTRWGSPV